MLKRLFWPDEYVKSVKDIDFKKIHHDGFRGLIFDIDNTIAVYDGFKIENDIMDLFVDLEKMGFKICFVSNSLRNRVGYFENRFNIKSFSMALKPLPFGIASGINYLNLPKDKIMMIGDQILTDVLGARLKNICVILVEPIKKRVEFFARIKRRIEIKILNKYLKNKFGRN